ncbi:MAG TPA: hypothetical protein K8V46_02440, partial [Alcaligenes faecalis]
EFESLRSHHQTKTVDSKKSILSKINGSVFLLPNWLLPLVSRYWRSVVPTHETVPYFRRFFVAPEDIALHGLTLFLLCIHSPCLAPKQLQSRA